VKRFLVLAVFAAASLHAATLATVNGDKITTEDVNILLSQSGVTYEQLGDEDKKKVVESAIDRKLMTQRAKKSGIEKDAEYKRILAAFQESLATDLYLKNLNDSTTVNEAETKKFYEENKARLERPETACANHILVEKEGDAKTIIKSLSSKKGADLKKAFEDTAKEKSIDTGSKPRGGDVGCCPRDRMVNEFSDAAFALKNGEMSKAPVKSDFGYHVILKIDQKPAGTVPFDEVADQLIQGAKTKKFQEALEKEIADLKSKAKIAYE
jgi:peptidylprolyl isomerase